MSAESPEQKGTFSTHIEVGPVLHIELNPIFGILSMTLKKNDN